MLIPSILATYRLAYLFTQEDGPMDALAKLRAASELVPILGEALQCPYCFSLWAALPVVLLGLAGLDWVVYVFAFSGGAMLLYEAVEALKSVGVLPDEVEPGEAEAEEPGIEIAGIEM